MSALRAEPTLSDPPTRVASSESRSTAEFPALRLASPADWPRVSVVVPALNEAENLPHVLPRIPAEVFEVILVDGHSTDGTATVARRLRPDIRLVRQLGRGKGDALAAGFSAARGEIIVMLDADGSARPEEIPGFVDVLMRGADVAKGSRFLEGGGSADITHLRRLGNRTLGGLVNMLFGTRYSDLCYGYNAFWARCLPHLQVDCDGFEVETLINVRAAKASLCIVEVPSYEDRRLFGVSNLNAVRDGLRVLKLILSERFGSGLRRQHLREGLELNLGSTDPGAGR
jgi:glycosyltransferase involved in cell wall biosynthesis